MQFVGVPHPGVAGAEPGVVDQVRPPDRVEHPVCERVHRGAQREVAVRGGQHPERCQTGDHRPGPLRDAHPLQRLERFARHQGRQRAQHGDVDVLALPGAVGDRQRRHRADHREQRCQQIRHRESEPDRVVVRPARGVHDPAEGLHDRVHRLARPGAALRAEAADRGVDEAGVDSAHGRVVDAEPLGDPGAVVLHQHVGVADQVGEHRPAAVLLQIQRHAELVATAHQHRHGQVVVGLAAQPETVAADVRRVVAGGIPAGGRVLHLDHRGAESRQQQGRVGARQRRGQVHDGAAREWSVVHGLPTTRPEKPVPVPCVPVAGLDSMQIGDDSINK